MSTFTDKLETNAKEIAIFNRTHTYCMIKVREENMKIPHWWMCEFAQNSSGIYYLALHRVCVCVWIDERHLIVFTAIKIKVIRCLIADRRRWWYRCQHIMESDWIFEKLNIFNAPKRIEFILSREFHFSVVFFSSPNHYAFYDLTRRQLLIISVAFCFM